MLNQNRIKSYLHVGAILGIVAALGSTGCPRTHLILTQAKLLIEHNATDEDTGFQGFADGDPWNELTIAGPEKDAVVRVNAAGGLFDFGLTELFFETSEPANADVPIEDVLSRLPEGEYEFTGDIVSDRNSSIETFLSHSIPSGPVLLTPAAASKGLDPNNLVVSWEPVSQDIDDSPITIVAYQVIVEEDAEPLFPQGFAKPVFSVHVPAAVTSVTVPAGFLKDNGCYKFEVLAVAEAGCQTLSSSAFETGAGCGSKAAKGEDVPVLSAAKLLIEHNATDEDTGFQGFADGDPWNQLTITGPNKQPIVIVTPQGGLLDFGLTELFFETSEPANAEVPITEVLAHLPEGTYTFTGDMVDGAESTMTATLSHDIPTGPVLNTPADGATGVDPDNVVVAWEQVTTDINGDPVTIVGYQVIVELDQEPQFPQGFAHPVFSIYLPATATNVTVPTEFIDSGAQYKCEVLAIEISGNQTLSSASFSTK
jgi:hypothetical protein